MTMVHRLRDILIRATWPSKATEIYLAMATDFESCPDNTA